MALNFTPHIVSSIAHLLLGDHNRRLSRGNDLRWGNNGSMSVDLNKATWHDHSAAEGGGMIDLVGKIKGLSGRDAVEWLESNGILIAADEPKNPINGSAAQVFKTVATYDYVDEVGTLIFQVVRQESSEIGAGGKPSKTFKQRRPDGKGGWVWSTKDVKQIPYRLPELIDDTSGGATAFICEGEKCADALRAVGIPATTCGREIGRASCRERV